MQAGQRPDNLSLGALEALLRQKRRRISEDKARRLASAEQAPMPPASLQEASSDIAPAPSPETWPQTAGRERPFASTRLFPLGTVEQGSEHSSPAKAEVGAYRIRPGEYRDPLLGVYNVPLSRPRRRWRDRLLFALEIVALMAFVAVLAASYVRLQALNDEARAAQRARPTALPLAQETPTADATPVRLLPGGDRPVAGGALPPRLDGLVKVTVSLGRPPTPEPSSPRRLVISKIGVDAPVVAGDGVEELKQGIGHRAGTANPGEVGNMVVSAHNDVYGEIFRDLDKLEPGDEVLVHTDRGAFRYVVNKVEIVLPTKVEVMDPTDYPALTMITCYPYLLDTHRVVALADLAP